MCGGAPCFIFGVLLPVAWRNVQFDRWTTMDRLWNMTVWARRWNSRPRTQRIWHVRFPASGLKHFHSVLARRLHRTSIIRRVQVVSQRIPTVRMSRDETWRLFVWLISGGSTARVPRSVWHDLEPVLSAYVVTSRGNVCTWDVLLTSTFCLRRKLFQEDATSGMSATFTGIKYREQFGCVSEKCDSS